MASRTWLTEPDEYECTLSLETQRIAKEELREDKTTRDQALTQMRDWVKTNPRIINCRLDSNFLLRFLRTKKFSCPLAQEALERYLLLRKTYGIAFQNFDITLPAMDYLLNAGYLFATPERDSHGRRVVIARPGQFDPYKFTNADMCRIHGITYETLMEDEESQVRGFTHFADGQGVGFHYLTLFTPKEAVRIVKNGERTLPMRHKEVHGFNVHPSVKFALDFGMSLISDKIKKRVKIHTSLEKALECLGNDRKVLPKEYGGVMPMAEMIELWKKEVQAAQDLILSHDKMDVQEDMFSEQAKAGAVSALRQGNSCGMGSDILGISGSFRKLEVD